MNVILFGAGASYGSDTDPRALPPLTPSLFDALAQSSPDVWGTLPAPYPDEFRCDFEKAMTKLGEDAPGPFARRQRHTIVPADFTAPLQRAMAEYFLQFSARPSSLYVRLACRIRQKKWRGALITLNYERLLEQALRIDKVPAECVQSEENKTGLLEVCFPHGCYNLFVDGFNIGSGTVFVGFTNTIEGPVSFVEYGSNKKSSKRKSNPSYVLR